MRRWGAVGMIAAILIFPAFAARASSAYADPQFKTQWEQGEAITPNFWGPLANAKDGQQEPYKEAQGGARTVQYFDKGRMELTNGKVTNGLLATELIKGQVQVGDATFTPQAPPAIPIAGDPDGGGPTYATLATRAVSLLAASTTKVGTGVAAILSGSGDVTMGAVMATPEMTLSAFDDVTAHNVPAAFAEYRTTAGLLTIGFGISEPFLASVKVAGQQTAVMVQVFERRVLTYTASNPDAFKVEMGNIGQHYERWRYAAAPASTTTGAASVTAATPTAAPSPTVAPSSAAGTPVPSAPAGGTPPSPTTTTPVPSVPSGSTPPTGSPGVQYELTVSITDATPAINGRVTLVSTLWNNGQPVSGTTLRATWQTGGIARSCTGGASGRDGVMTCTGDVGAGPSGEPVRVDFFVADQQSVFGKSAYFTPR
jgi:hypothetical protein